MEYDQTVHFYNIMFSLKEKDSDYIRVIDNALKVFKKELAKAGNMRFFSFVGSEEYCSLSEAELQKTMPSSLGSWIHKVTNMEDLNGI